MIDFDMIKMGARIKELRVANNLSQKILAEKIGIAQNTLAQYESGKSKTSLEVLVNLAVELNTTSDYLLGLED